ncbi:MAG TPA: thioredoxin domain-containing protein [Vicinamibacteria bacterium]|nr:thioredoxin domain-containing protein [Vicinamibacteria bacterium]
MNDRIAACALGFCLGALGLARNAPAGEDAPPPPSAVAVVGGVPITAVQLEDAIKGPLMELRLREDSLRSQALDELITEALLEREAGARGISLNSLLQAEVEAKATLTPSEAKAFYESHKERFRDLGEAAALKEIEAGLKQQRQRERREAFVRELRAKAGVRVLREPLRVAVGAGAGAARGPLGARVTIVEFSDFQCPYCARARQTLDRVRETYGDRVRTVYRDFPLPMHPEAAKAAEAGACAGEQGKFWEMHDRIFDNQARLLVPDLKHYAGELGLDTQAFEQCLDSGRHAPDWQRDLEEGARYGVSATPAFFINGRPLVGAVPFENFAQVIDDELAATALRPQAKKE